MRAPVTLATAVALLLALTGCNDTLLSDGRIQSQTSTYLGQPVTQIYNRRTMGISNTLYDARTPKGQYSCLINGSLGLTAAMTCRPI